MASVETTASGPQLELEEREASLLRELCREMRVLLGADIPRADPVIARLYPDAYEEEEDSTAYRELVETELRAVKSEALRATMDDLGTRGSASIQLSRERIDPWLTLLTDMRLAIGTRLDLTEDDYERELDDDDPNAPAMSVFHWLGWLQESILESLDGDGDDGGEHDEA